MLLLGPICRQGQYIICDQKESICAIHNLFLHRDKMQVDIQGCSTRASQNYWNINRSGLLPKYFSLVNGFAPTDCDIHCIQVFAFYVGLESRMDICEHSKIVSPSSPSFHFTAVQPVFKPFSQVVPQLQLYSQLQLSL